MTHLNSAVTKSTAARWTKPKKHSEDSGTRSSTFPEAKSDMFDANTELAHAPISHGDFLKLVAGLTYFWQGTDPATLFGIE